MYGVKGNTMLNGHHERRREFRLQTSCQAWVRNGNNTFERAELRDLSESGALVNCASSQGTGAVDLVVKLSAGAYVSLTASTAWKKENLMGLRFSQRPTELTKYLGIELMTYRARSITKRLCTLERARLNRERTVPTGMSTMSATS